jgi:two-component system, NarL family, response regulator LiaR
VSPASSTPTAVLLVDDHHLFRSGLREMLAEFDALTVVGEADSGDAALSLIKRRQPDVVIMDLSMPGISGAEATRRVRELSPRTEVVVLTVSGAEDDVIHALGAGATGYLLKDAGAEEIVRAVTAAAKGGSVLSPAIARTVVERARRMAAGAAAPKAVTGLSEREREVLCLLAEGKDNAEIAAELFLSVATVKRDVSTLLAKLGASNRVQAAIKAVRSGLL